MVGLIGLAIGSFLNVCIDRLPSGQSLLGPPSHCPSCKTKLASKDLVPVFSYLWLRGKCRYCGVGIPWRLPIVEVATGVAFGLVWYNYGLGLQAIGMLVYISAFMVVLVADLERGIIPNWIVYPGLLGAFLLASLWPEVGPLKSLLGGGVGLGIMLLIYMLPGGVMGEGDVKLGAMIGLAVGFPLVLEALGVSFVLGGIVAIAMMLSKKRKRRDTLAFGPYMSIAAIVTLAWGPLIWEHYLDLFR